MGASKGRRGGVRSKLVEPYFQIKLGLMFVIVNILFSLMISLIIWWLFSDVFRALKTYFELSGGDASATMHKLYVPIGSILATICGFIAVTLYVAIHYTHKIYGPLVSINRFVDEMVEGRTPARLNLREGDELKDLADKLNTLADKIKVSP